MWTGEGGQVSSSSYHSNVAEESVSSVMMPDVCGLRWKTPQKMDNMFQTTASDLRDCGSQLKDLYTTRGELKDKLQFIELQINRAEDEQRKAKSAFKANHFPILPDATDLDLKHVLGMDFSSLQDACLCGPLTEPGGPLCDVLAGLSPEFDAPVDYFAGPSTSSAHINNNNTSNGPSTSSAHLISALISSHLGSSTRRVSSTAGSVVRRNVRFVPALLPLRHAQRTDAFNAGYNNNNDMPVEGIRPLKIKRLVNKSVLPTSRKHSKKNFWTAQFSRRSPVLPASNGDGFPDLFASIN